jgi:hypothetical protein
MGYSGLNVWQTQGPYGSSNESRDRAVFELAKQLHNSGWDVTTKGSYTELTVGSAMFDIVLFWTANAGFWAVWYEDAPPGVLVPLILDFETMGSLSPPPGYFILAVVPHTVEALLRAIIAGMKYWRPDLIELDASVVHADGSMTQKFYIPPERTWQDCLDHDRPLRNPIPIPGGGAALRSYTPYAAGTGYLCRSMPNKNPENYVSVYLFRDYGLFLDIGAPLISIRKDFPELVEKLATDRTPGQVFRSDLHTVLTVTTPYMLMAAGVNGSSEQDGYQIAAIEPLEYPPPPTGEEQEPPITEAWFAVINGDSFYSARLRDAANCTGFVMLSVNGVMRYNYFSLGAPHPQLGCQYDMDLWENGAAQIVEPTVAFFPVPSTGAPNVDPVPPVVGRLTDTLVLNGSFNADETPVFPWDGHTWKVFTHNVTQSNDTAVGTVCFVSPLASEASDCIGGIEGVDDTITEPEPGVPTLVSVAPTQGMPGQIMTLALTGSGTHWTSSSVISFQAGITVVTFEAVDEEHITVQISISTSAAVGSRDVRVTTGTEIVTKVRAFMVRPLIVEAQAAFVADVKIGMLLNAPLGAGQSLSTETDGLLLADGSSYAQNLPPGVTYNPHTTLFEGSPTTAGSYLVTVIGKSVIDDSVIKILVRITIGSDPVWSYFPSMASKVGQPFYAQFRVDGGSVALPSELFVPNGSLSVTGALPPGVSALYMTYVNYQTHYIVLTSATQQGDVATFGFPSTSGNYPITVNYTDKSGGTYSYSTDILIESSAVSITVPASLANGHAGVAYAPVEVVATGGLEPYRFTSIGLMPAGMYVHSTTGEIQGTPSTAGSYQFSILVTDANNEVTGRMYTLVVV